MARETCTVAPRIVYEAATVWLINFVLAQERFSGPKLLRALGGWAALSVIPVTPAVRLDPFFP